MIGLLRVAFGGLVLAVIPTAGPAAADDAAGTVVVFNRSVPDSQRLAELYAQARRIPAGNLVGIEAPAVETISRDEFATTIEAPLREVFSQRRWWQVVDIRGQGRRAVSNSKQIIALIYGVPLKINEAVPAVPAGQAPPAPAAGQQNQASVDSELTLLGLWTPKSEGPLKNPYFGKDEKFAEARLPMMMLVARLDAPTPRICERMVNDSIAAESTGLWGRAYLDLARKGATYDEGDAWLLSAGKVLGTTGWPVIIDAHAETLPVNYPMTDAGFYFGWWIRNVDGPFVNPDFRFRRGAIAYHMHSFAAETIRSDAFNWVGPLLTRGAAAVLGTTWEPYLTFCTRADVFTDRLLKGYTLAEATWMATPGVSWMNVVAGDPLYRPFAKSNAPRPPADVADYQLLRSAVSRHRGAADQSALISELEAAASARNSGTLWEAVGLLVQTYYPDDIKRAAASFDKAGRTFKKPADRIRAYLHVPDMERRNNQLAGAIADLRRIMSEFPNAVESQAAKAWLQTLQPPPPPAPPPAGLAPR